MNEKPEILTTPEAAKYLGLAPSTLEIWRSTRRVEIPYVKLGRRVGYRRQDLDEFLESRTVRGAA